ncbi:hypothetical protein BX616_009718 [Lobosporangium transversale]|nr:hypothetical protein BX616_009718 [Lobosporangium transversale]
MHKYIALSTYLLLQCSVFVSSALEITNPNADTVWFPGTTYDIVVQDDHTDVSVESWQVDLLVLGVCDGICLHDGVVARIAKEYETTSSLKFTVPTDLTQHGKGFVVQFSNAGWIPIYQSGIFTIEKTENERLNDQSFQARLHSNGFRVDDESPQQLWARDMASDVEGRKTENAAPYVLPAVLATTMVLGFSCVPHQAKRFVSDRAA